ncbi:hypothetical protein PG988_011515 [Apiospora saccharicola]
MLLEDFLQRRQAGLTAAFESGDMPNILGYYDTDLSFSDHAWAAAAADAGFDSVEGRGQDVRGICRVPPLDVPDLGLVADGDPRRHGTTQEFCAWEQGESGQYDGYAFDSSRYGRSIYQAAYWKAVHCTKNQAPPITDWRKLNMVPVRLLHYLLRSHIQHGNLGGFFSNICEKCLY